MQHVACRYVQWCHGAPSLIPVLVKAYELLDSQSSAAAQRKVQVLDAAKQAADVVWERGLLTKVGRPFSVEPFATHKHNANISAAMF